ncbi:MAG: hypothetical protein ABI672_02065 [Vicinamibacteria bacterium]
MDTLNLYQETAKTFLVEIGAFLPRLLVAFVVVLVGFLVSKAARFAIARGLKAMNFSVLTSRSGLDGFLKEGGYDGDTTAIFAGLAGWLVLLASLLIALNGLGLTYITELLSRVVWFVPNVFVALLVLAFGSYFARFVGDTAASHCRRLKLENAAFLGRLVRTVVMVFVILIALDQVKVGGDIVRQSFLIVLSGFVFALSLAFGLGARGWAEDRIEHWWPRDRKPESAADAPPKH